MSNQINSKNNSVKNFNENKGDVTMENMDLKAVTDMIMENDCEQQSPDVYNDVYTATLIKQKFNDGQFYIGSIEAIYSDNDYKYRAVGEETLTWVEVNGTFIDRVKVIFTTITEKIALFESERIPTKLLFVVDASIAIKCFMALGALNKGEDYITPLVTFKKERQEDLVETATKMMEAIISYKDTFKLSIQFDNFDEYSEEVLIVSKEAKKLLKNGMPLHFDGKNCTNVPGVSFRSNWHTAICDYILKIIYGTSCNKNSSAEENNNEESEKTPLRYVVERKRNDNGVLTAKRGAFMTELWSMLLKKLPAPKLSKEQAKKVFDSFKRKKK